MLLPRFEYLKAQSIEEAISLLEGYQGKARPLAGGTDLLVQMKHERVMPQYLVGLRHISGLDYIRWDEEQGLSLGSLTPITSLAESPIIQQRFDFLAQAASSIGSAQIRNVATLGGNLCNAAPSADMAPPLIALDARVRLAGPLGERRLTLEEFYLGPGETALGQADLLLQIQVPPPRERSAGAYIKFARRKAIDIAIVGVAALIVLNEDNICQKARLVLGAVSPTPLRVRGAEESLEGHKVDELRIQEAARLAAEDVRPISDVRASAGYRRELSQVLVKRALNQALAKLGGGNP